MFASAAYQGGYCHGSHALAKAPITSNGYDSMDVVTSPPRFPHQCFVQQPQSTLSNWPAAEVSGSDTEPDTEEEELEHGRVSPTFRPPVTKMPELVFKKPLAPSTKRVKLSSISTKPHERKQQPIQSPQPKTTNKPHRSMSVPNIGKENTSPNLFGGPICCGSSSPTNVFAESGICGMFKTTTSARSAALCQLPRTPPRAQSAAGSVTPPSPSSPQVLLPTVTEKCPVDLKSISAETLADILRHKYDHLYDRVYIIDCRFTYEYEGGHIAGAINVQTVDELEQLFFHDLELRELHERVCIVFHCEFSSHRGPTLCRHLRGWDRAEHCNSYPQLYFPELYILSGGYKHFYETHPEFCVPQGYVPMKDRRYSEEMRAGLNTVRRNSVSACNAGTSRRSWSTGDLTVIKRAMMFV